LSEKINRVAKTMLERCLGIDKGDDIIVVCDQNRLRIADALAVAADRLEATPTILVLTDEFRKTRAIRKARISKAIENAIRNVDVVVLCVANVQRELEFRRKFIRQIRKSSVRVANLPGITERTFAKIGIAPRIEEIEKIGNDIARILANGKTAFVTSPSGTKIRFELYGWKVPAEISSGYLLQPSTWGNLPGAEVYVAPKAWSANGVIAIDVTIDQDHRMRNVIIFEIRNGRVVAGSIESRDKKAASFLRRALKKRNGDALCEFGIGLNSRIKKATGITLIDEKMLHTAHFALGDNVEFGGEIESNVHYDMIFSKPSVWIDEKQIMKDGVFTYSEKDLLNSYRYFEGKVTDETIIETTPWSWCIRMNGGLAHLWRGGTGRMHAFILGDKETSEAAEKIWTALSHGGSSVAQIAKRTRINLEKVKKVIDFMIFQHVLDIRMDRKGELRGLSKKSEFDENIELLS